MAKEFAVTIDDGDCINCGICMDVCSIRTLDMTRAREPGPEGTFLRGIPGGEPVREWMMSTPVQVDHCNGCTVCVRECPTQAISIRPVAERPAFPPRQGLILTEPEDARGWVPLSAYTRAAMRTRGPREAHDPWGKDPRWRIAKRVGAWQVWRTWTKTLVSSATGRRDNSGEPGEGGSK